MGYYNANEIINQIPVQCANTRTSYGTVSERKVPYPSASVFSVPRNINYEE
jgi:hypothetical protein